MKPDGDVRHFSMRRRSISGAEFRGGAEVAEVTEVKGGMQVKLVMTVEVRGAEKPALVAECLYRYYA